MDVSARTSDDPAPSFSQFHGSLNMKRTTFGTWAVAVARLAPALLEAREPMGHQHTAMADQRPMLGMPGMALMHQDELDLTAQQTTRLETPHARTRRPSWM
jgi:hypothetical protein